MSLEAMILLSLTPYAMRAFRLRQRYSAARVGYGQAFCSLALADGSLGLLIAVLYARHSVIAGPLGTAAGIVAGALVLVLTLIGVAFWARTSQQREKASFPVDVPVEGARAWLNDRFLLPDPIVIEAAWAILLPNLNAESVRLAIATQQAVLSPSLRWRISLSSAPVAVMLVMNCVAIFDAAYHPWNDLAGFALMTILAAVYISRSRLDVTADPALPGSAATKNSETTK